MALGVLLLGSYVVTSDDGASIFGERVVQMQNDDSVQVGVLFGSADVVVPDGVQVRQEGFLVFGGVECLEACTGQGDREVVIDTRGAFGSVDILSQREFLDGVDLDDREND